MSEWYWQQLRDDYCAVELISGRRSTVPNSYADIDVGYAQPTTRFFDVRSPRAHSIRIGVSPSQTDVAQQIHHLSGEDLPLRDHHRLQACSEAETTLLLNLGQNIAQTVAAAYGAAVSPVVVTHGNESIALVKGYKEASVYGLVDALEWGIVRAAFSEPAWLRVPRADHAWQIDVADLGVSQPMRFSQYAFPVSERAPIATTTKSVLEKTSLLTAHDDIVAWATTLLTKARPISAAELRPPTAHTPLAGR